MAELHQIPRSEAALRDALARFCEAAWRPAKFVHIFSQPPQPDDADLILSDGLDELIAARAELAAVRAALAPFAALYVPPDRPDDGVRVVYRGLCCGHVRAAKRACSTGRAGESDG